ncbi:MAG: ABC transporter ATP-binding protein, partial [Lachnospiraceae bacterium]|nr:ABC transporter ATP-binding protein [Lachnospiraceae bacterium]
MSENVKKKDKDKLSLGVTIKNAAFALKLAAGISPAIVIHSFFLWLIGHGEWVFFDGVFMRVIVNGLDQNIGFDR